MSRTGQVAFTAHLGFVPRRFCDLCCTTTAVAMWHAHPALPHRPPPTIVVSAQREQKIEVLGCLVAAASALPAANSYTHIYKYTNPHRNCAIPFTTQLTHPLAFS